MFSTFLKYLSYVAVFFSIWISNNFISEQKYNLAIRSYLIYGLIPLALISAFRHMILTGSIVKGQSFFEFEAGGANLAIGLSALWSIYNNFNINVNGTIILAYTIYLISSLISWIIYNKNNTIIKTASFLSIIAINIYFAYISFNH